MVELTASNLGNIAGVTPGKSPSQSAGATPASNFADVLKKSIDEVSKLQEEASQAVEAVASGQSQNVTGVMSAVEKADLAFKTLLAIRTKLMDAYDEIKQISI
jgi:flagellar hook-basal body complex protein FliE